MGTKYQLAEVSANEARTADRILFVHGWKRLSKKHRQTAFYRCLRDHGYQGQIWALRWPYKLLDPVHGFDDVAKDHAAEVWDWFGNIGWDAGRTSLLGYSAGSSLVRCLLWEAAAHGAAFRRAYFIGSVTSACGNWARPLRAVQDKAYVFWSSNDGVGKFPFNIFCPRLPIGCYGLDRDDLKLRSIDCSSIINSHYNWETQFDLCLRRAGLRPHRL